MRMSKLMIALGAISFFATAAFAQSMGGSMSSGSMSAAKTAPKMTLNAQGGFDVFSRQNMAMMIVDRDKATKAMSSDQAKAARQEEMAKDQAETPDQRMARKKHYDAEWAQLSPAEQSSGLAKYHAQLVSMGIDDGAK
jgi:hypothetical protein